MGIQKGFLMNTQQYLVLYARRWHLREEGLADGLPPLEQVARQHARLLAELEQAGRDTPREGLLEQARGLLYAAACLDALQPAQAGAYESAVQAVESFGLARQEAEQAAVDWVIDREQQRTLARLAEQIVDLRARIARLPLEEAPVTLLGQLTTWKKGRALAQMDAAEHWRARLEQERQDAPGKSLYFTPLEQQLDDVYRVLEQLEPGSEAS